MLPQRPAYRLIDLLKIVAAQCIVLHHFALYGPLSDATAQAAPELAAWFYDYARMAVQVFLVVAGYLAARSLGQTDWNRQGLLRTLWQRYERLVLPFAAALLITMLCSALARPHLDGDLVPASPQLGQWLAHASLLHSVLGVDSLSAGVWYVAIDFQLYALMALLLWLSSGNRWVAGALVAAMVVAATLKYFVIILPLVMLIFALIIFATWVILKKKKTETTNKMKGFGSIPPSVIIIPPPVK